MKKILINDNAWQSRIAITRDNLLQNIYLQTRTTEPLERCFFKGVVKKVLPGTQSAFIDIGQDRAGFLHISEIDRELALKKMAFEDDEIEEDKSSKKSPIRKELNIGKILREGEHILVQVSKEPIYEKGAKLTTCFTLPGRFLVLMPNIPRIGISKKISEREERQRLREILMKNLPEGMGAIIRTTSEHRDEKEILQDLKYLTQTWTKIQKDFKDAKPEEKIHQDIEIPLQVVRDHLDSDVEALICDNPDLNNRIYRFVKEIAPEFARKVQLYKGTEPLYEKYGIEKQLEQALRRKVPLKSGGSIIIETAEAMTVVDVNTGKYVGATNLEETILNTNMEAAEEIVRQLRLRNIGGLIVIDFIDMTSGSNRQKLFRFLEKTLKERDKFQSVVLKVSEFGLVQMTRKRSGKTLVQQMTRTCSSCGGYGFVKSVQTETFEILRNLKHELKKDPRDITVHLKPEIFDYILNTEYNAILQLEKDHSCKITLESSSECK